MKTKMDYNHGRFVIATTSSDGFDYGEYLDYCEMEGYTPGDKDSLGFYEWAEDEARVNFESDMDNIRHHKPYNVPVVIEGSLGLWWGWPDIEPVRCESVYEALVRCIGRDGDYFEVEYVDGVIEVTTMHHDGTNRFTIRALSKKGERRASGEYKDEDFKRFKYLYA